MKQKKSYSVVNTHKAMLLQTLNLFVNEWCANPKFISRFMKGLFSKLLPKPRYSGFIWDVSVVLKYLSTIFPLDKLSLKLLTLKVTALIALSAAPRAQTIISMNLDCMTILNNKICFQFKSLLKTSKQGKNYMLELLHFDDEKLCVMHTVLHYINRTKVQRKSQQLLLSYCSYKPVTLSTVARWLKEVLLNSGIDIDKSKAHSYCSAAVSAAFSRGCSLDLILKTADWSSAKNFKKFYLREIEPHDIEFSRAVIS